MNKQLDLFNSPQDDDLIILDDPEDPENPEELEELTEESIEALKRGENIDDSQWYIACMKRIDLIEEYHRFNRNKPDEILDRLILFWNQVKETLDYNDIFYNSKDHFEEITSIEKRAKIKLNEIVKELKIDIDNYISNVGIEPKNNGNPIWKERIRKFKEYKC